MRALAAEDSDVDILAGNMAEDDTSDDDLLVVLVKAPKRMVINEGSRTVGMARP